MSPESFALGKEDPVLRQFRSGLEAWERPFDAPGEVSALPVYTAGVDLGEKFIAGLLGPRPLGAEPAGERALVVNTACEMPIEVVDPDTGDSLEGFRLSADGHVAFGVKLRDPSALPPEDVRTFFIDVLFVPASDIIYQQPVGSRERMLLGTVLGLRFDFELPRFDDFLEQWQTRLRSEGQDSVLLPKTVIALRIWWD